MKKILQSCIAVLGIALLLLIPMELSSATLQKLGSPTQDIPFMLKYSDEEIRQLYSTQDALSYREALEEQWLRKGPGFLYEPFVQYRCSKYEGRYVIVSAHGCRHVKNQATDCWTIGYDACWSSRE